MSRSPVDLQYRPGMHTDSQVQIFWDAVSGNIPWNTLSIQPDELGGVLVPDEFERTLVKALEDEGVMRKLCRVVKTTATTLSVPVVDEQGSAAWVNEGQEIPESDSTFEDVLFTPHQLSCLTLVSQELLQDSKFDEEAFIVGDGQGKPTGFLETAIVAKSTQGVLVGFDDLIDLYQAIKAPYREKAVFLANSWTLCELRKLKDSNGQYIWKPSLEKGVPETLLGKPVYESSHMPQPAVGAKAVAFGDFSYYWIVERENRRIDRLAEAYAKRDMVGFLGTERVDGHLLMPEAVKVLQLGK